MRTQADDDAYKVGMERALKICSARGDALVEMIDGANAAAAPPRPWWRFGR